MRFATSSRHASSGFTLIELAIVIVIIALIIGGILTGKDLIATAANRKIIDQMVAYQAAFNTFKLKYNCMPGDCINVRTFFGTTDTNGNAVNNGDGNGVINGWPYEVPGIWQHLSDAGLISEAYTGAYGGANATFVVVGPGGNFPGVPGLSGKSAFEISYQNGTYYGGLQGNLLTIGADVDAVGWSPWPACVGNSGPCPTMRQNYEIDNKIDDGMALTGKIRISWLPNSRVNANGSYNLNLYAEEKVCSIGMLISN